MRHASDAAGAFFGTGARNGRRQEGGSRCSPRHLWSYSQADEQSPIAGRAHSTASLWAFVPSVAGCTSQPQTLSEQPGAIIQATGPTETDQQQAADDPAAPLRSADEVRAEEAIAAGIAGTFGVPVESFGVTASDPRRDQPIVDEVSGMPMPTLDVVKVDVCVENRSVSDAQYAGIGVMRSKSDELENWVLGSTFDPFATIPAGTYSEGAIRLHYPDGCVLPARLIFSLGNEFEVGWVMPDELFE